MNSGAYQRQCCFLHALLVAPTDLVGGMQLKSLGGDMLAWPVAPLLALLTEADLQPLLGAPARVAGWCRDQLCRPPAERPAGLTAGLDTPQGRAEVLLQPELQMRAVIEAVPTGRSVYQRMDRETVEEWKQNYEPLPTYQSLRLKLEQTLSEDLEATLRRFLPEMDDLTVASTARCWRQHLVQLLDGDQLRARYAAITTRLADNWRLRQYVVTNSSAEGET